jgi:hypothetical protein
LLIVLQGTAVSSKAFFEYGNDISELAFFNQQWSPATMHHQAEAGEMANKMMLDKDSWTVCFEAFQVMGVGIQVIFTQPPSTSLKFSVMLFQLFGRPTYRQGRLSRFWRANSKKYSYK